MKVFENLFDMENHDLKFVDLKADRVMRCRVNLLQYVREAKVTRSRWLLLSTSS